VAISDINRFDGSIICDTSLVAQGSEDGNVANWNVANEFVLCVGVYVDAACNKASDAEQIQIEFRKDGGGWTPVGAASEIAYGSTLTNGASISAIKTASATATSVCGSGSALSGVQVSGTDTSNAMTNAAEIWTEVHFNLDPANAAAGSNYEFRLTNTTASVVLQDQLANTIIDADITMAAAAGNLSINVSDSFGNSEALD